ncbi:hypothetical protein [Paludisphaera soli]|nr:hypothetical protein [Paludisphaera soli]
MRDSYSNDLEFRRTAPSLAGGDHLDHGGDGQLRPDFSKRGRLGSEVES